MNRLPFALAAVAACVAVTSAHATAGPATSYADGSDDAYVVTAGQQPPSAQLPNPVLSDAALDLTTLSFGPGSAKQTYTVGVTLTGAPSPADSYVSAAQFGDPSAGCNAYYFVRVPASAIDRPVADAYFLCGQQSLNDGHTGGYYVGHDRGTAVLTDAHTVTATFSSQHLPQPLMQSAARLHDFFAWSCPKDDQQSNGCRDSQKVDVARSAAGASYTLR